MIEEIIIFAIDKSNLCKPFKPFPMITAELEKTGLKEIVIGKIRAVLSSHPEVEEAILYGSRAKGNFKPYSDIDLSLKGAALNLSILHKIEYELDDLLLPYNIDLSVFNMISNEDLVDHIEKWGVRIYEGRS